MSKTSEIPGSKNPIFMASPVDRHTDRRRTSRPGGTPLHAGKSQPVGGRSRLPTPTTSLLCQARKKWSTSSLFQPPHWSGRRFWARHRCTLGAIPRLRGPSLGPWPGGYPPFGPVFGINGKQSSHKLESPLGRACLRVWRNKVVLGKLCASATRDFFLGQKVADLEPE